MRKTLRRIGNRLQIVKSVRLFAAVYGVFLLFSLALTLFTGVTLALQLRTETLSAETASLERLTSEIDKRLYGIEQKVRAVSLNPTVIRYQTVDDPMQIGHRYDVTEIMQQLSGVSINDEDTRGMFVFYPNSRYIITPASAYTYQYFTDYIVRDDEESGQYPLLDYLTDANYLRYVTPGFYRDDGSAVQYSYYEKCILLLHSTPAWTSYTANVGVFLDNGIFNGLIDAYADGYEVAITDGSGTILFENDWPDHLDPVKESGSDQTIEVPFHYNTFRCFVRLPWNPFWGRILSALLWQIVICLVVLAIGLLLIIKRNAQLVRLLQSLAEGLTGEGGGAKESGRTNIEAINHQIQELFQNYRTDKTQLERLLSENAAFQRQIESNFDMVQNGLLLSLINAELQRYQEEPGLYERYNIHFAMECYSVLLLEPDYPDSVSASDRMEIRGRIWFALHSLLHGIHDEETGSCYLCNTGDQQIILIVNHRQDPPKQYLEVFIKEIKGFLESSFSMAETVGVSRAVADPRELHKAYAQSRYALMLALMQRKGNILFYDSITGAPKRYDYSAQDDLAISNHLKNGEYRDCVELVDRIVAVNLNGNANSPQVMRCVMNSILSTILRAAKAFGVPAEQFEEIDQWDRASGTDGMRSLLVRLIRKVIDHIDKQRRPQKNEEQIHRIRKAVDSRCLDGNFSLTEMAEAFSMSPSALSQLFKNAIGMNLSDYVAAKRLEEVLVLLETPLSMQEIADRVGFGTAHTLIRVFKQRFGVTPGAYRRNRVVESGS